jgi:hypothetical protein
VASPPEEGNTPLNIENVVVFPTLMHESFHFLFFLIIIYFTFCFHSPIHTCSVRPKKTEKLVVLHSKRDALHSHDFVAATHSTRVHFHQIIQDHTGVRGIGAGFNEFIFFCNFCVIYNRLIINVRVIYHPFNPFTHAPRSSLLCLFHSSLLHPPLVHPFSLSLSYHWI